MLSRSIPDASKPFIPDTRDDVTAAVAAARNDVAEDGAHHFGHAGIVQPADALRAMLAEDVQLELVGMTEKSGAADVGGCFDNYARVYVFDEAQWTRARDEP